MNAPGSRPFFVTDSHVVVGCLLAQAGFDFEVDCSPDYRVGKLLLSPRAWAWMQARFPGIENLGQQG